MTSVEREGRSAVEMILEEREHQIARGWTAKHDDRHTDGEIAAFAYTLLGAAMDGHDTWEPDEDADPTERWVQEAVDHALRKHPRALDRLRIVGALIVAEMERHIRLATPNPEQNDGQR